MAEAEGQDGGIEEPEAFATLVRHPKLTDEEAGWLIRDRDEAVVAAARREVLEACCAAICPYCAGRSTEFQRHVRGMDKPGALLWHPHVRSTAGIECIATRIHRLAAERGWLPADRQRAREEEHHG